jgi:MinD-like ATPase involved in chromosome partitioning or flagellar assembly
LAGIIIKDPQMSKAVRQRQPLLSVYPQAIASRQILKLASHVVTLERKLDAQFSVSEGKGL